MGAVGRNKVNVYPGAAGVSYGLATQIPARYSVGCEFAGKGHDLGEVGYTTFAHFGIWGDQDRWLNPDAIREQIPGTPNDAIPSFTEEQKKALREIL